MKPDEVLAAAVAARSYLQKRIGDAVFIWEQETGLRVTSIRIEHTDVTQFQDRHPKYGIRCQVDVAFPPADDEIRVPL